MLFQISEAARELPCEGSSSGLTESSQWELGGEQQRLLWASLQSHHHGGLHSTPSSPRQQELPHTTLLASPAPLLEQNERFPPLAWHCHTGSREKGTWALRRARCIWEAAQEGWVREELIQ